jgi:multidrug efflux system membrane fusion protein
MNESLIDPEFTQNPVRARKSLRSAALLAVAALTALSVGAAHRVQSRKQENHALVEHTRQNALQVVSTVTAKPADGPDKIVLPGTLRGFVESPIHARSSGYLLAWHKNIGEQVRKGDLLAEIDTPEIDQQLSQTKASREPIRARLGLAKSTLGRWENLAQRLAVSKQELDERHSAYQQAEAELAAADAEVKRLEQLDSFKKVFAPFDGLVVKRNVDVGELIGAGSAGANRELFTLAQIDPLRIIVSVPQSYANVLKAGQEAIIKLTEYPNTPFKGTVERLAGALDPATRSMQIEIILPNKQAKLLPGAYAEVSLNLGTAKKLLTVPANALIFGQGGPKVAVVGQDQRIALRPVKLGRDSGMAVEVLSGVGENEKIVVNPPDSLEEGLAVQVAERLPPNKPQS